MRGRRHLSPQVLPKWSPATRCKIASVFEHQDRAGEELLPTYCVSMESAKEHASFFLFSLCRWSGKERPSALVCRCLLGLPETLEAS
jgi:hypothetical protein